MRQVLVRAASSRGFALALLCVYFLVGACIYRDYGLSSDEKISRTNGRVTATYVGEKLGFDRAELAEVFGKTPRLAQWKDKDYGVHFEVALVAAEVGLGVEETRSIYQLRHLLTFACFSLGLWIFYLLACMTLASPGLALLGTVLLATTPKVFAHAFYNSKDIPFMVACILAAFTLLRLLRKPTLARAAVHGVACALAVTLRIPGAYLAAATLAMVLIELLSGRPRVHWLRITAVFLVTVSAATYALWPYLWEAPLDNFAAAFEKMSNFRYKRSLLFQGETLKASDVPWQYIPVWIAITIPPVVSALFLLGSCLALKQLIHLKGYIRGTAIEREPALVLGMFLVPLLAVIALHSVLYGSWRQLFFIYPFLLLTSLYAVRWLLDAPSPRWRRRLQLGLGALLGLGLLNNIAFLIRSHPHQAVYFNWLAGADPGERYEMDSYGAAYYHGLAFLLEHQPTGKLRVGVNRPVGKLNALMLPKQDRARIKFVPSAKADYFISNYRGRPESEVSRPGEASYENPIKLFEVDGSTILGVYAVER